MGLAILLGSLSSWAITPEVCSRFHFDVMNLEWKLQIEERNPGFFLEDIGKIESQIKEDPTILKCATLFHAFDNVSERCPRVRVANFLIDQGIDIFAKDEFGSTVLYDAAYFYGLVFHTPVYEWRRSSSRKNCITDVLDNTNREQFKNLVKRLESLGLKSDDVNDYGISPKKLVFEHFNINWDSEFN
jgi:hypothetical protein